jgi:cysteine desulfurase
VKPKSIFLDYAATTPAHPEVVKEMIPFLSDHFGNPSSLYAGGQKAKAAIESARQKVAGLIGASADEIVFTSSGTEADNFAIKGTALANRSKGNHIITSSIEHHAVLESCKYLEEQGFKVTYLPVDKDGMVHPQQVRQAISNGTILISIMQANNEIGVIEPILDIARIAREKGITFHTDAVQSVGHIPIDVDSLQVDLLSASAHKFYGPKGVGFLFVKKGTRITPLIHGGGQEKGRRSSTENVPGIVGMGKASALAVIEMEPEAERLTRLRDRLIDGLSEILPNVRLNGHRFTRLPNNINISIENVEGESLVIGLDKEGIDSATRSACSSSEKESSHVLKAIGLLPELANASLRLTLGKWTTAEDVEHVLDILPGIVAKLRASSPIYSRQNRS